MCGSFHIYVLACVVPNPLLLVPFVDAHIMVFFCFHFVSNQLAKRPRRGQSQTSCQTLPTAITDWALSKQFGISLLNVAAQPRRYVNRRPTGRHLWMTG
jgi:hypothetical protein